MPSNFKSLGDYIQLVDIRNNDRKVKLLRGVSTSKQLIKSVANMSGVDIFNYKIVDKDQFVYVADTSRRGERVALALNDEKTCIVSSIYTVFEVKDKTELLPEYLFIWFKREEFDRYARFHSWGSARETFDWEEMCKVKLPIPSFDEQQSIVSLYKGLLKNQKVYETSLIDLQLICDTYIENLIKSEESKTLGGYIVQSDERNSDLKIDNLLGISVNKKFISSNSNQTNLSLASYKVVREREFGYVTVTSRNGEKISVALLDGSPGLVSSTYIVFKVKDSRVLLPEFLFLWFQRSEFDRYVRFNSWGSARETFDWAEMCRVKLPIPNIEVQEAIVTIYHTLQTRKKINVQLKEALKPLCTILIKGICDKINDTNNMIAC
ncbi:type I restriction enzyme S subunit [Mucilaginibacter sp. UYNi724]